MGILGAHGAHGNWAAVSSHANTAILVSSEGIREYWDVQNPETPNPSKIDPVSAALSAVEQLQPVSRAAVLAAEAGGIMAATGTVAVIGGIAIPLQPPSNGYLRNSMRFVKAAADLRSDRYAEIMVQQGDLLYFFAAQERLDAARAKWTLRLMGTLYDLVVPMEQQLKFYCSSPRPIDFSRQVMPIIQTPGHSTYPSGHAIEAYAFATYLAALRLGGTAHVLTYLQNGAADPQVEMLFKLAARIAENRTVAGVHFPIDSAHGSIVGAVAALVYCAALEGKRVHGISNIRLSETTDNDEAVDFTSASFKDMTSTLFTDATVVQSIVHDILLTRAYSEAMSEFK